jgi:hypothetical protein
MAGIPSGSLAPRYRVSDLRYRTKHSISKTSISNAHSISTFFAFDIVYRYRRCSISKVPLFDIEGDLPSISNVIKRAVDIDVSSLRYRTSTSILSIQNIAGACQDIPGYDRCIAAHDRYRTGTYLVYSELCFY